MKSKVRWIALVAIIPIILTAPFFLVFGKQAAPVQPALDALRTLPYATWASRGQTSALTGVTRNDPDSSFKGMNIYNSSNLSEAVLMDMTGRIVHRWSAKHMSTQEPWYGIKLDPEGDLLVIIRHKQLVRLDWDSQVKWAIKGRFHHDIQIAPNGDIYTLANAKEIFPALDPKKKILTDYVVVVDRTGNLKRRIALHSAIISSHLPFADMVKKTRPEIPQLEGAWDVLHTNALRFITRDVAIGPEKSLRSGDLLFSLKYLNLVGVLDSQTEALKWSWGPGELDGPHTPVQLDNGNILIFDNGCNRGYTRVIELNPASQEIVWSYQGSPAGSFFSPDRGSCQRLPNGNTLIAESAKGHILEVTRQGQIVWEYYNPEVKEQENERAAIYRFYRIIGSEYDSLLARLQ